MSQLDNYLEKVEEARMRMVDNVIDHLIESAKNGLDTEFARKQIKILMS